MGHEIDLSTGKAGMAYVGQVPWHGLGTRLAEGAPIEVWLSAAGLNWSLVSEPVMYRHGDEIRRMEDWFVLSRSDTGDALSVVSKDYFPVQPGEVLKFYDDLTRLYGYKLETAGALFGGRKIWALAKTGLTSRIPGDEIDAYLLLATSCDKTLATTAAFTSVRVVCNNTLSISLDGVGKNRRRSVKVAHNRVFDAADVKMQLGVLDKPWESFIENIHRLSETSINDEQAERFFTKLLSPESKDKPLSPVAFREHQRLMAAYHNGLGQNAASTKSTAWGLVNAVTYYVDHVRPGGDAGARLNNAWFGTGATLKDRAWDMAVDLASGGR